MQFQIIKENEKMDGEIGIWLWSYELSQVYVATE